jgi:hypothetical protein
MAKTQNQANETTVEKNEIVEKEQVVINENDIVSGEDLKENDVIDVNSPEVTIEKNTDVDEESTEKTSRKTNNKRSDNEKIRLKIRIAFTDKYNDRDYKENDIVEFEKERASELLSDTRRLVEKVD